MTATIEKWRKRKHKQAISRAYNALCVLGESICGAWCLENGSMLEAGIILNPSDEKSGLEIIATPDGLVEMHAEQVRTLDGDAWSKSKRWQYTVVTVSGSGWHHDDPCPSVDESKPMPLDAAIRQFAIAAATNKIEFAKID